RWRRARRGPRRAARWAAAPPPSRTTSDLLLSGQGVEEPQDRAPGWGRLGRVRRVPVVCRGGELHVVVARVPAEDRASSRRVEDEGRVGEEVVLGDDRREAGRVGRPSGGA